VPDSCIKDNPCLIIQNASDINSIDCTEPIQNITRYASSSKILISISRNKQYQLDTNQKYKYTYRFQLEGLVTKNLFGFTMIMIYLRPLSFFDLADI
jgi:hypothetical protein